MRKIKIPRTMSTQHPDNVSQPFFVEDPVIAGDDEVKEAYHAFSNLGIREQLWDCEGKEVDNFVVEKLLSKYPDYFEKNKLGENFFITLRAPNPRVETNKGKLLLETLESIPRSSDIAAEFYKEKISPIFEIAIPMVSSSSEIIRVKKYYDEHIIKKQHKTIHDIKLKNWVGESHPEKINVIPLIEDKESMLDSASIVQGYLDEIKPEEYQRVWLARSDPALNYGMLPAILLNRLAFQRLHETEERNSIDIEPIIGCGSVPFRGNFRPDNIKDILKVYPSVRTYTLQSAFKYDYPQDEVKEAAEYLENTETGKPVFIDEEASEKIIEKISSNYQSQIRLLSPLINQVSVFVPQRRKRRLHVGLFGYSRETNGVKLPRAIKFCASLYSAGLPPELLGYAKLSEKEWDFAYENTGIIKSLKDSAQYLNTKNLNYFPEKIKKQVMEVRKRIDYEENNEHKSITSEIMEDIRKNNLREVSQKIEKAASIRKFLG